MYHIYHGADVSRPLSVAGFCPPRLFPRWHLYDVGSHRGPTLIAQEERDMAGKKGKLNQISWKGPLLKDRKIKQYFISDRVESLLERLGDYLWCGEIPTYVRIGKCLTSIHISSSNWGNGGCHTGKVAVSRGGYLGNVEQHFGWNPQSLKSWSISLFSSPCQPLSACPALPWVLNALIISTGPSLLPP